MAKKPMPICIKNVEKRDHFNKGEASPSDATERELQ